MSASATKVKVPEIKETGLFIDGRFGPSSSGKTFPTINPATEEVLAEVAEGTAEDVDRAVQAARKALESGPWPKMDARDRGALLHRLADAMLREAEELAVLETLDNGKRIADCRAIDIPLSVEALRYYAGYADKIYGKTIPVRGPLLHLHAPRAGGRGRPDHPVELPAARCGLEVGPGPGRRLHGRDRSPPSRRR